MRIAVLTSLYPGPTRPLEGVFAERRWQGMRERGHEIRVVHPLPRSPGFGKAHWREIARLPRAENRGGIPVERPRYFHVPGMARLNARNFARRGAEAVLAGAPPEVCVADYAWPAAAAAPRLRRAGIPVVVHGRGSDVLQVAGEAGLARELAAALRTAGHWCAVSRHLVQTMDRLAGRPGTGRLTPNGVDLEAFGIRERSACRNALGLPEDGRLVLVCGHLIPRKDPLLALAAFEQAAGPCDRIAFVGRGPLEGPLRATAARRGLVERVLLAGEVPPQDLVQWYGACDALLLVSRREGRPNVVLEALACGRPVLATAVGGTGELLERAPSGMLVDDRSPRVLGQRLRQVLDTHWDPQVLRESVAHLSWRAGLDALERCLEDALP